MSETSKQSKWPWMTGHGFAPPSGGRFGWWFVWGWFRLEWHPKWWRIGLSFQPWVFGLMLGPLVVAVGPPEWRWRVLPATANAGSGDSWQDHAWTITVATGTSNQEGPRDG